MKKLAVASVVALLAFGGQALAANNDSGLPFCTFGADDHGHVKAGNLFDDCYTDLILAGTVIVTVALIIDNNDNSRSV